MAISSPVLTELKASRFVMITLTPPHSISLKTEAFGLKLIGTKRAPLILRLLRYPLSFWPSIHGAPTTSNGVSVPRPTETFVVSSKPMPGYNVASVNERIFGDGFVHIWPVSSNHIGRDQPSIFIT